MEWVENGEEVSIAKDGKPIATPSHYKETIKKSRPRLI
jgi:antitoxin (DNA-binding transcriptional repressor) of toxin-antitoxin stability system